MKKFFILIPFFVFLLCACMAKPNSAPAPVPAESTETAQTGKSDEPADAAQQEPQGEMMYNSFIYSTLDTEGKTIWVGPNAGIKEFRVPEAFTNAKGGIRAYIGTEANSGTGVTKTDIMYIPSSKEAYEALIDEFSAVIAQGMTDEESIRRVDEASMKFQNSLALLFTLLGIPNSGSADTAKEYIYNELVYAWLLPEEEARKQADSYNFILAGSAETYNFYLAYSPNTTRNAFDGEKASWKEEYDRLWSNIPSYAENFIFAVPEGLAKMTESDTAVRFSTTDLNGNPVSSDELFSGHKATMINVWTTTCTGCISEMPELNRMSKEFEAKGGQIIGIVYDATEADLIEDAKEITSDLQIEFRNLLPNDEIKSALVVQSFPTTYFVNEKGELIGTPVAGAQPSAYRTQMNEMLGE